MWRTEADFFGSLVTTSMIEVAGAWRQRNTLQAHTQERHEAEASPLARAGACLFMDLFAEVEVIWASSCDAVHSSCLWAQHATAGS